MEASSVNTNISVGASTPDDGSDDGSGVGVGNRYSVSTGSRPSVLIFSLNRGHVSTMSAAANADDSLSASRGTSVSPTIGTVPIVTGERSTDSDSVSDLDSDMNAFIRYQINSREQTRANKLAVDVAAELCEISGEM